MPPLFARPTVTRLEPRDVPVAGLQVVNDTPAAAAQPIDVYVNDVKLVNDLAYRQSTGFTQRQESAALKIDIVAGADATNAKPLLTQTIALAANSNTIVAVVGDPTQPVGLKLAVAANGRFSARAAGTVDVLFLTGSPDATPLNVKVRDVGTLSAAVPAGAFAADYVTVPAGRYIFDVTRADNLTPVGGSFAADLTGAAGKAVVIDATGYTAAATARAAGRGTFGLLQVDNAGTGTLLPRVPGFAPTRYAVGGTNSATLYGPDGKAVFTVAPFPATPAVVARVAAADVTGDGLEDLVVASGPGVAGTVTVYDGLTQAAVATFAPFEAAFTGGVFVAAADLTGDFKADIVATPDQGGGARVTVRSGADVTQHLVGDFFGIEDAAFRGGARPALADLTADGTPDLIVSAGFGGGPRVAGFNGRTLLPGGTPGKLFADFFAFEPTLRDGAYVAGGDINGDGYADLVAGGGPGGGPRVYALSGKDLTAAPSVQTPVANYFAGDVANRDGVRVAVRDLDGDYKADVVVGLGSAGVPQVRTFLGKNTAAAGPVTATTDNNPFATPPVGGVFVG